MQAPNSPLDILTPEEHVELVDSYKEKLAKARETEKSLLAQLADIRASITRWDLFVGRFAAPVTADATPTAEVLLSPFQEGWGYTENAKFAIENPHLIEQKTIAGNADVIKMLLKYDPALLTKTTRHELIQKYRGVLSTLSWQGKIGKLREKANINRVHYLPLTAFDNGQLKPEYQDLLTELEYVPTKAE